MSFTPLFDVNNLFQNHQSFHTTSTSTTTQSQHVNEPTHCQMCPNVVSKIYSISATPIEPSESNLLPIYVNDDFRRPPCRITRSISNISSHVELVSCPKQKLFLSILCALSNQSVRQSPTRYRYNELMQLATHVQKYCMHRKVRAYFHDIIQNTFISNENKNAIFGLLMESQRRYHALLRFRYHLYWKTRAYGTTNDLNFNQIPSHQQIHVHIDNANYTFSCVDIVKIFVNSLTYIEIDETYAHGLYNHIQTPRNPYTNNVFPKSALYEIYWQLKKNVNLRIPPVITFYFQTNFSIRDMYVQYEGYVHRLCVERFIREISPKIFCRYARCMIEFINKYSKTPIDIQISEDFPPELVIEHLGTPTRNFIRAINLEGHYVELSKNLCKNAIDFVRSFSQKNPRFGRKIVCTNALRRRRSSVHFINPNPT